MPRDWDAATYDRLAAPMTRWGADVVGRLDLAGTERALDAGCGTGRVTAMLLSRLPRGHVIALDGSPSMIEQARRRLARFGDRVSFLTTDLLQPLPIEPPVDAILSTATFHWIPDHDSLLRNLASVLRPGGQLAAQCGGVGNVSSVEAAVRELGYDPGAKNYAAPQQMRERLERAGFTDIRVWLQEEPTEIRPPQDLEPYLRTICLGNLVEGMSEAERDAFVGRVAARMPGPRLDYVRLNIVARRAG